VPAHASGQFQSVDLPGEAARRLGKEKAEAMAASAADLVAKAKS
jgi:hypothetical protein